MRREGRIYDAFGVSASVAVLRLLGYPRIIRVASVDFNGVRNNYVGL